MEVESGEWEVGSGKSKVKGGKWKVGGGMGGGAWPRNNGNEYSDTFK